MNGIRMDKESLFARVTCFLRLPRLRLAMTIISLIFCMPPTASQAEDEIPTSGTCNDAGTCLWSLSSDGTMTISAAINPETGKAYENVSMENYLCDSNNDNRPWKKSMNQIKNVMVGDNIVNIGSNAFQWASELETVTGMKDVELISVDAFVYDYKLSSIYMPKVKTLRSYALASTALTSVDIPQVTSIEEKAFYDTTSLEYIGIGVDENGNPLDVTIGAGAFSRTPISDCSNENRSACGSCGTKYIKSGLGCVADCGAGYLGKEEKCVDAANGCGENYRQVETWCNRIRYTPADAAKVLKDTDNEIIMTFKVNR